MFEYFFAPFYDFLFMQKALVGCVAIALSSAPVGVFLMLRRMSLTGDAMAHAILPGAAVGYLVAGLSIGAMTLGGIIAGSLVALVAGLVSRVTQVNEDSSLAAFYLISLAAGVLIISSSGSQVDLLHVLFGSALALNNQALILLASICTFTLVVLAVLFRPLVVECMDRQFLQSVSRLSPLTHMVFLVVVVVNLVGGFNALGTLMSVGMMILPAALARYWVRTLDAMLLVACIFAIICSYVGLLLSYHVAWPAGPSIILMLGMCYSVSLVFGPQGGLVTKFTRPRHLSA
ncbi:MAG: metal ABC transporter permease [Oleiphilaceae bacterium]|nr:metal ABC transporter permease [Oleiphilaceae bacterium]